MARAVLTGGAGFLGSHLCDALVARGDHVVAVDNCSTGSRANVAHLLGNPRFELIEADVVDSIPVGGPVDFLLHFASPASPPKYLAMPLETLRVGSTGTENALRLATERGARFLLASTSEVYGDPTVHPQPESYWGNVNPVGLRSVYDEAKRYAEAVTMAYRRTYGLDTAIVRIFNTYGPRMDPYDGRAVSTFLRQALTGEPLTVFGDGSQTRSYCYVDDEVRGILALLDSDEPGPINLGSPAECTILDLALLVLEVTGSASAVEYRPLPEDDPMQRQPALEIARERLCWEPRTPLREGLTRTVEWVRHSTAG
jgi:dTDP-glucose 4,6-dehydratase